ncbi:MAG: GGDEF domain-containing protein [Helicobacteraceae bacterium]|jgi:diguanylate cyclase (GGDEF)-like protein|nr:GGDEF domain-containing protein [Helicobacteraceae bacterium]
MKYIYPVLVLLLSFVFIMVETNVNQRSIDLNYFGLAAYGSITIIMLLALFIVQKISDIQEVYFYLLAGFSFVYVSLLTATLKNVYTYAVSDVSILEDLFRLVGFGFVIVAIIKWIKYNEEVKQRLIELASTDDLTGIMNRRVFDIELIREFANAKRYNKSLSLITVDIDNFKIINDKHGHFMGDLVLKLFTNEVLSLLRQGDLFSRWGGDEFSILLPQTSGKNALRVAEKIRFAIKNIHVKTDHDPIYFTVSLGITEFLSEDQDHLIMVERADKALYEAKESGRDKSVPR